MGRWVLSGQHACEKHTLLEASMNLTPLYVMDRMMVGTFFMCSVDFYRKQGVAFGCPFSRQSPLGPPAPSLPIVPHMAAPRRLPLVPHLMPSILASPTMHNLPASWHRHPVWILSLEDL